MNTNRDNYYDWARDKEDTTFSSLQRADFGLEPRRRKAPWGLYLALLLVLGAGGYAARLYLGA